MIGDEDLQKLVKDICAGGLAIDNLEFNAIQKPFELFELAKEARALSPHWVVEIGSHYGGTMMVWSRVAAGRSSLVSIDTRPDLLRPFDVRPFQDSRQIPHDSHSRDARVGVEGGRDDWDTEDWRAAGIDFLFIDGDHSYRGALLDFTLYSPLVRSGGIIAFHDIVQHPEGSECKVSDVWRDLQAFGYRSREIVDPDDSGPWGGIGLIWMP